MLHLSAGLTRVTNTATNENSDQNVILLGVNILYQEDQ